MLQPCEGEIRMQRPCLSTLLTQRTDWKVCNGDILKRLAHIIFVCVRNMLSQYVRICIQTVPTSRADTILYVDVNLHLNISFPV